MMAMLLHQEHSTGEFIFECWRTEHNDIALRVTSSDNGKDFQADFTLTDNDTDDLIEYLKRAKAQRVGQIFEGTIHE